MKDVQSHLKPGEIAIEFVKYWDYLGSINFYDALVLMPDKEYPFWIRLCKEDDINDRLVYNSGSLNYLSQFSPDVFKDKPEIFTRSIRYGD